MEEDTLSKMRCGAGRGGSCDGIRGRYERLLEGSLIESAKLDTEIQNVRRLKNMQRGRGRTGGRRDDQGPGALVLN